jgi:hypothetical protein
VDSRVGYHRPDVDAIKKQIKRLRQRKGRIWKPTKGNNLIRILPPWSDEGTWYKEVMTHFKPKTINCPTLVGKRCAICERRQKLRASASPVKQKAADALEARVSYFINMVDLKSKDEGVQIGRLSEKTVTDLLEYFVDGDWGDFSDPRSGYNIVLHRLGEGQATKYTIKPKRTQSRIEKASWLKQLHDLDKRFEIPSFAETRAAFEEEEEEEEEDYSADEEDDEGEEYDEEDEEEGDDEEEEYDEEDED